MLFNEAGSQDAVLAPLHSFKLLASQFMWNDIVAIT